MKRNGWYFLLALAAFGPAACNKTPSTAPASPALRSYGDTPTPTGTLPPLFSGTPSQTPTFSATPSPTPNAACSALADVTSFIDGNDYPGDDAGHTLPPGINLDQAGYSTGDLLTFTLSSPRVLSFSLCPTEDTQRKLVLYIRPDCSSPAGEYYNAGFCLGLPQLSGLSLAAGTYYVIVAENGGASSETSYLLRIRSGSAASAVCTVVPAVTPAAVPPGTYDYCGSVYALNGGAPLGTGQAVATGQLDDTTNTDDFISFTPAHSGSVTVTLDCFDNGLNDVDFDVYAAATCPTNGTTPPLIGLSESIDPTEQFSFNATAGTTYYVDVEAFLGSMGYRLTVQAP